MRLLGIKGGTTGSILDNELPDETTVSVVKGMRESVSESVLSDCMSACEMGRGDSVDIITKFALCTIFDASGATCNT
jgi:hypothetical protein